MTGAEFAKERNRLSALVPNGTPLVVVKVLSAAIADIGIRETGRNDGPEIAHLIRGNGQYWWNLREGSSALGLETIKQRGYVLESEAATGGAWCAMAVSNWIRTGLGLPYWDLKGYATPLAGHPFGQFLNGPSQIETWAKASNRWHTQLARGIPPGAVFTMDRAGSDSDTDGAATAGHTGLVIRDDGEHVVTIEGNVGDAVVTRRRPKAAIRGWAKWW